ncbi:DUF262 domain-containing protein [Vibrio alginolyticus]|uniref:DUF262 domain-containing protein n=1 Tax=Vibrio alginolyticus TaxID=663 RepID=UPI002160F5B3|nr:DUF262 domain-containing protein [Vibrio alginolyticus]MCS0282786.1 DUF262 domain-containing protein [Vibrio alginolyticus]
MFSESEKLMWLHEPKKRLSKATASQINEKYEKGEHRIVTETNREKLPNFIDALKRNDYMEVRPFYQRRSRWDVERQSKLIESFIINIPVPPIFLYEQSYNSYEVMDGQQRITAIEDFYNNKFTLTGLDLWPELNGLTYSELPNKVRAGLDRRAISSIVLLTESAQEEEDALFLRQLVFERLNTGGIKLERQEIRNSLGSGMFNDLLFTLARQDNFRQIWELPAFEQEELTNHKLPIYDTAFFKKMEDIEVVLRFFALRHMEHYRYGIQGFLDLYMVRSKKFKAEDCEVLGQLFNDTLQTAISIFGNNTFKVFENGRFSGKARKGVYDAVMVPLSEFYDNFDKLIAEKDFIIKKTVELFEAHGVASVTGRASTKADLENRIDFFRQIFMSALEK